MRVRVPVTLPSVKIMELCRSASWISLQSLGFFPHVDCNRLIIPSVRFSCLPISGYDSPCTGVEADAFDASISSRISFITYVSIEYSPFGYFPFSILDFLTGQD